MSGIEILVDTNILIYLLRGDETLVSILQGKDVHLSFISELELFGLVSSAEEENRIQSLLDQCIIVPLNKSITKEYKELRKSTKLKLADSVVAATAMALKFPILTADKHFTRVANLNVIHYTP